MKILIFALATLFSLNIYGQEVSAQLKKAIKQDDVVLLKKGLKNEVIDICYPTGKKSYTLLMLAIKIQAMHSVKYLAKKSTDINLVCIDKTALMYAVESGDLEMVKILVKAGADVKKAYGGRSAIDYAIAYNHSAIKYYFNSMGIYKTYELSGTDGPYVFGKTLYRVNKNSELKQEQIDRNEAIEIEVENEYKDRFKVQLRSNLKENPAIYSMPEKLIAISDIEGNFNAFQSFLVGNDIIDEQYNWTYGNGHLVLVGDFFDRGNNVTAILWLIYSLEAKAEAAGGKVHFILGNHEVMNIQADTRYTKAKYLAVAQKISNDKVVSTSYRHLFSAQSELGRWLRTKNVMEKIGNYLFVHAGLHPEILDYGLSIDEVNEITRKNIDFDLYRYPSENTTANFLAGSKSPIWYRGLATELGKEGKVSTMELQQIFNYYQVKKVVIGHTMMRDITTAYDGKVIKIDVNHSKEKKSGQTKGLLVKDDVDYKVNDLGQKEKL